MTEENLCVLYKNIKFGMPSEEAWEVFLWAIEQPFEDNMCYRAENFAHDWHKITTVGFELLEIGWKNKPNTKESIKVDLRKFLVTRLLNMRLNGNLKLPEFMSENCKILLDNTLDMK